MLTYYFINHTKHQIRPFDNTKAVILELEKACSSVKGWSIHQIIVVDVDKGMVDYLVIQKDYEFLGY